MKNVNLIFWVKAISLVANFGFTGSASTSVDHKKRIRKSSFLTPRPPSGLKLDVTKVALLGSVKVVFKLFTSHLDNL